MELVGDLELHLLDPGMSWSSTRPSVLASETTSVPQPKIRSITPISKSTPLIRLSGIVRPSLAIRPERLMKRRLVKVYVVVSQR